MEENMAVKDERIRILKMIEEGKLSAEEGAKLLEALEEPEKAQKREIPLFHHRAEGARVIRIRVTDVASEKVKVNISVPFTVVEFLQAFIPNKEKEKMEEKGIDVDSLIQSIKAGEVGKILDVYDEDEGQRVEISVE
jgi:DUF4097 and DUF4098 domain-containing protein YvlB